MVHSYLGVGFPSAKHSNWLSDEVRIPPSFGSLVNSVLKFLGPTKTHDINLLVICCKEWRLLIHPFSLCSQNRKLFFLTVLESGAPLSRPSFLEEALYK